jgi:hypothetical protein
MPAPTSTLPTAKREVLQGLAQALAVLAGRIKGQSEAAREVGLLTAQAEALAAQAWALASANRIETDAVADLAAAIASFIEHALALSQRVAREASNSNALAAILRNEAIELEAAGRELDGVNDMTVIRARLRPLLDRLTAAPARLEAMTEIASDVAGLGNLARRWPCERGDCKTTAATRGSPPSRSIRNYVALPTLRDQLPAGCGRTTRRYNKPSPR